VVEGYSAENLSEKVLYYIYCNEINYNVYRHWNADFDRPQETEYRVCQHDVSAYCRKI